MIFLYKLISHRGISNKDIKENSFIAIKKALECDDYVGVEFDVRTTLDNEFVLYHNPLYNNKLVKNTLYKELPKYVPKLNEVLKIESNKIFLIEIKNIGDNYDKLIDILKGYDNKKLYVMSFSNKIISKMDINERNYKIGILNYVFNTNEDTKKLDFVGILNSLINDNILNSLKNIEIFSYGLFDKKKSEKIFYIVDNNKNVNE